MGGKNGGARVAVDVVADVLLKNEEELCSTIRQRWAGMAARVK